MSCCQTLGGGAVLYGAVIFGGWLAGGPRVVALFAAPAVLLAVIAVWRWRRKRRRPDEWTARQAISSDEQAFLDGHAPMPAKRPVRGGGRHR